MLDYRRRRRPSRGTVFLFLLALVFVGANYLLADKAHAAHNPDMTVEFDKLELVKRGPQLVLDYRFARGEWRQMRAAGITPQLNLYVRERGSRSGFAFAYSLPLERRAGEVVYPREVKVRGTKVVELEVVGFAGFNRVTQTRFGDACGPRVRLRLGRERGGHAHHPQHPSPGHGAGHDDHASDGDDHGGTVHGRPARQRRARTAAILAACKEASSSINASTCLAAARELPAHADAVATVKACGASSNWTSQIVRCLGAAKEVRVETAAVVRACDEATQWSSELDACIARASDYRFRSVARTITTCDEVTTFGSEFSQCLDKGKRLGARADRIIRACEAATNWTSEFNACLDEAGRV